MEEQGQDPNDLALYGQDSNGTVWSICNMNMILHNISRFTIENGDTLEDPQILENGQIRKFDRVLANPPFSQNYSRASVQFPHRFREWCPETGKKADLMFVQHMLASLKKDGQMATNVARNDFARLERANNGNGNGRKMPDVRLDLLTTIKEKLVGATGRSPAHGPPARSPAHESPGLSPILDEFKSAGVFVNWWQQIRYDLKTVVSTGWHHTLIPDDYLIAEFFQAESDAIEALDAKISELQSELAEAVETAQEIAAYEPDEDEKVTAAVIKKALKDLIDDLNGSTGASARKELYKLKKLDDSIKKIETRIKDAKATLKEKTTELELKIELKRLGSEGFMAENLELIRQVDRQIAKMNTVSKTDQKKSAILQKDKAALLARIARTDTVITEIGGQMTDEEAKRLILKKLYDIAGQELERYLNAEKRALIQGVENLWNKYAISSRELERKREETLGQLNGFLEGLGYLR